MRVSTGLDVVSREGFPRLRNRSIGVLCNQASLSSFNFIHLIDLLFQLHKKGQLKLKCVLGPQHGLFGHTQDNMIEWEGESDPRIGIPVHSLYGEHREPQPSMLEGIEELVVDLPDVGSRYYTFTWTMALSLKVCEQIGIGVTILDRPNPIGGIQMEGTLLRSKFSSFVGEYPVPTRYGMTLGEIATYLQQTQFPKLNLTVVKMEGWNREMYYDETDLPWFMPSPNMPTMDSALVYPGGCLLEATNLSEGRGTTRPFEIFGAPFLDSWEFTTGLNGLGMPGCLFRPLPFQPTFNKYAGQLCGGCQLHVTSRNRFEPVLTYVGVIQEAIRQSGLHEVAGPQDQQFVAQSSETRLLGFAWRQPPYEYVHDRRPIDILAGNDWLEPAISGLTPLSEVRERFKEECSEFEPHRRSAQLY